MKKFTITISGQTESDIEIALNEVKRIIAEGYLSGMNSNDTGEFKITSEGDYEDPIED